MIASDRRDLKFKDWKFDRLRSAIWIKDDLAQKLIASDLANLMWNERKLVRVSAPNNSSTQVGCREITTYYQCVELMRPKAGKEKRVTCWHLYYTMLIFVAVILQTSDSAVSVVTMPSTVILRVNSVVFLAILKVQLCVIQCPTNYRNPRNPQNPHNQKSKSTKFTTKLRNPLNPTLCCMPSGFS